MSGRKNPFAAARKRFRDAHSAHSAKQTTKTVHHVDLIISKPAPKLVVKPAKVLVAEPERATITEITSHPSETAAKIKNYQVLRNSNLPGGRELYGMVKIGKRRVDAMYSVIVTGELPGIAEAMKATIPRMTGVELEHVARATGSELVRVAVERASYSTKINISTGMRAAGSFVFNSFSLTQLATLFHRIAMHRGDDLPHGDDEIIEFLRDRARMIQDLQLSNATPELIAWTEAFRLRLVFTLAIVAALLRDVFLDAAAANFPSSADAAELAILAHDISLRSELVVWLESSQKKYGNILDHFASTFPAITKQTGMTRALAEKLLGDEEHVTSVNKIKRNAGVVQPSIWRNNAPDSVKRAVSEGATSSDIVTVHLIIDIVPVVLPQFARGVRPACVVVDALDLLLVHTVSELIGQSRVFGSADQDEDEDVFPGNITVFAHIDQFLAGGAGSPSSVARITDGIRILAKFAKNADIHCHLVLSLPKTRFEIADQVAAKSEFKEAEKKQLATESILAAARALICPLFVLSGNDTALIEAESTAPWSVITLKNLPTAFVDQLAVRIDGANEQYGTSTANKAFRLTTKVKFIFRTRIRDPQKFATPISELIGRAFPGVTELISISGDEIIMGRAKSEHKTDTK